MVLITLTTAGITAGITTAGNATPAFDQSVETQACAAAVAEFAGLATITTTDIPSLYGLEFPAFWSDVEDVLILVGPSGGLIVLQDGGNVDVEVDAGSATVTSGDPAQTIGFTLTAS
ncbi:hypothetical protein [Engelhardtia mirabilis]